MLSLFSHCRRLRFCRRRAIRRDAPATPWLGVKPGFGSAAPNLLGEALWAALRASAHLAVPSRFLSSLLVFLLGGGGGENLGAPCKRSAPSRRASQRPHERRARRAAWDWAPTRRRHRSVGRTRRRAASACDRRNDLGAAQICFRRLFEQTPWADSLGSVSQLFQTEGDARRAIRASLFFVARLKLARHGLTSKARSKPRYFFVARDWRTAATWRGAHDRGARGP